MVFGCDSRQSVGLIAITLKIGLRDPTEHAGEARRNFPLLLAVGGSQKIVAGLGCRHSSHLFDADNQRDPATAGGDEIPGGIDRSRTRGAGIFAPHRRFHL